MQLLKLDKNWIKSKREGYFEVTGEMKAKFSNGSSLILRSNKNFDESFSHLKETLQDPIDLEIEARLLTEKMACLIQASIFIKTGEEEKVSAFCNSRLGPRWSGAFGTLPTDTSFEYIMGSL